MVCKGPNLPFATLKGVNGKSVLLCVSLYVCATDEPTDFRPILWTCSEPADGGKKRFCREHSMLLENKCAVNISPPHVSRSTSIFCPNIVVQGKLNPMINLFSLTNAVLNLSSFHLR